MKTVPLNVPQAHEARRIVDEGQYQKALDQAQLVQQLIADAIARGEKCVGADGKLELPVKQSLQAMGYQVSSGGQYNEDYWSASW